VLVRRAFFVVVGLPVVLGYLRTLGERAGYFDAPTGRSLLILSLIGLLLWLLFWAATVIRRREQRALAAERAGDLRYRMLFNSIDQGFCIIELEFGPDGRPVDYLFLEVNAAFERQTGLRDVVGKRMRELAPGHERHWAEIYGRVATTGESVRFVRTADALGRVYDVYAFRLEADGAGGVLEPEIGRATEGRHVAVLFSDITERRRDEEALRAHRERLEELVAERTAELERSQGSLRRAERLAAIGTLAAGLGHDLANLVLPMRIRLESLGRSNLSNAAREDLDGISEGLSYIKRLSAGLRQLAADPEAPPPADGTDLYDWWPEAQGMLKAVLPRHVRLEGLEFGSGGVPRAGISRVALTQIVFNLVQNAGEAMATGPEGTVRIESERAGNGVQLVVIDDGPGMSPEVVARCFEPYFSTKGRGVSTGMGLALVRGMVESAGGSVQLRSSPGKGAVFTIWLPAAGKPGAPDRRGGAGEQAGAQLVAAVDVSDPRRRALIASVLGQLGVCSERSRGDASLWVTDERPEVELKAFCSSGTGRRVLVFAEGGERDTAKDIVALGRSPSPDELRRVIREAVVRAKGGL
ncbi:MAG TPA: ATP-binding protein, partial [Phycisphaerales bacterium]|nr:ATP-binding protein [Phycisphaerales bacterium]